MSGNHVVVVLDSFVIVVPYSTNILITIYIGNVLTIVHYVIKHQICCCFTLVTHLLTYSLTISTHPTYHTGQQQRTIAFNLILWWFAFDSIDARVDDEGGTSA